MDGQRRQKSSRVAADGALPEGQGQESGKGGDNTCADEALLLAIAQIEWAL